ncbi:anaphase-promoting complex subunit 4-like [Stegodyphus dumicola]|uniref:anaphase-promoting complex subunit 4-like n=1 Tax=Stegodyphus dumicola TaxID=202533 RepID=UPI0015ACAA15|nr:anaphase-promoting complex subunit 4-like [Stegodyphus dumicola]
MTSFRQLEQRHVSAEIALMEWNPMLDLIALATVNGEVILHRLTWQKVWSFPSPSTKDKVVLVTAIAWRPDGKILAYAYDNGKVTLCDVENSEAVHLLDVHCIVTSLSWVQTNEKDDAEQMAFYSDRSAEYLQKLFTFHKTYGAGTKQVEEVADDFKRLKGQKSLNILAIGMDVGMVHLHSFGMFPSGYLDVNAQNENGANQDKVLSVTLSKDFRVLTVIVESKDNDQNYSYYFKSYSVSLLCDNTEEIKVVALKYGQISSLLTYLSSTIRAITEAWEDILLEVDTKLHNYAYEKSRLSEGSISDDFLELLMFGNPTDSLEKFLLHDLTESGLKKFGHSIELSYSNIQKLILKRLQNVASSLFYHLNDLKGMAMWHERFGALGLSESAVNDAVLSVGSFLLKATEIQQVIDSSMKNFKAFFRWLYSVILRLSDEPIPLEISKLTQQDLHFVAEFLKENFTSTPCRDKKTTVKLERVAQYLKKEDLAFPASTNGNPWVKFLEEHPIWKESGIVFPYYSEKSLITQYTDLRKVIDVAVKGPWTVLKNTVHTRASYLLYKTGNASSQLQISHISCFESGYLYTAVTEKSPPSNCFYLIREATAKEGEFEGIGLTFKNLQNGPSSSESPDKLNCYKVLDVKFYNKDTITVLLLEDFETDIRCPVLLQLPLKPLCTEMKTISLGEGEHLGQKIAMLEAGPYMEKNNYKRLEYIKASKIAVSGSRKVVCVLFASKRQVRLFEMDVEEEEEEEGEPEHEDSVMKDSSKDNLSFASDKSDDKLDKDMSF